MALVQENVTVNDENEFGNRFGNNVEEETPKQNPKKMPGVNDPDYDMNENRPGITHSDSFNDDNYWGAPIRSWMLSKNQIRTNISKRFQLIFSDFVGCNLFISPTEGIFKLIAFFGENGLNSSAKNKAFNVRTGVDFKDRPNPLLSMHLSMNKVFNLYHPTREGHGILSDFVPCKNPKEKNSKGWIKNFNKYFKEVNNTPMQYNGYAVNYYLPQQSAKVVFAAVELDIESVLRMCFDRFIIPKDEEDKKVQHIYNYVIVPTNTILVPTVVQSYAQQEADYLVEIREVDSTEMSRLAHSCGLMVPFSNPYMRAY